MNQMQRYAVYYAPRDGDFSTAAAAWLGWDAVAGGAVPQPEVPGISALTAEPRKYGFHGTLKPPFRLAEGVSADDLSEAVADLATRLAPVEMPGLQLVFLDGFLAMILVGDTAALLDLAAQVVVDLDPLRAPLTEAEIARRRPESLTPRQRELLASYGYPYVLEQFQFHLTLSGRLQDKDAETLRFAAIRHFDGLSPQPFRLEELCLFGEDQDGRFHLLHRYPLMA
ncbi:Phn_opern_protn, putative phosphonate metabolism protein [Paracoccaceae bacterium]|jgi:putative phosphonate metabolism protein